MGIFSIFGKTQREEDGGKAELLAELEALRDALDPVMELLTRRHSEATEAENPYAAPMAAATESEEILGRLAKRIGLMLPPRDGRRAARLRDGILEDLRRARDAVASCGSMFSPLTEELLPLLRRADERIGELLSV